MKIYISAIFLLLLASACLADTPQATPTSLPENQVATLVAATLQTEGTLAVLVETAVAALTPSPLPDILPHSLYFLSDMSGKSQIWRLEKDGHTLSQFTFAQAAVTAFDFSPATNSLVYISDHQLIHLQAGSESPRVLLEVNPDPENFFRDQLSNPRFSPNGKLLAFALNGIQIFSFESGQSTLLIENQLELNGSETPIIGQVYFPESWSPDGQTLLITVGLPESNNLAFLPVANPEIILIESAGIACCHFTWTLNGDAILLASPHLGLLDTGLWRYDLSSGAESVLIPTTSDDATISYVAWPLQAPDQSIYYFYSNTAGLSQAELALLMVRSSLNNMEQRENIREDNFSIREVLWAPDASFALIVQSIQGGGRPLVLARTDGSPIQVLVMDARHLRWGP